MREASLFSRWWFKATSVCILLLGFWNLHLSLRGFPSSLILLMKNSGLCGLHPVSLTSNCYIMFLNSFPHEHDRSTTMVMQPTMHTCTPNRDTQGVNVWYETFAATEPASFSVSDCASYRCMMEVVATATDIQRMNLYDPSCIKWLRSEGPFTAFCKLPLMFEQNMKVKWSNNNKVISRPVVYKGYL